MKRRDARGRPLDYEKGQIHQQFELVPADINGHGYQPRNAPSFREQLDKLVGVYEAQGKRDAILFVTGEQERLIRGFTAYPPNPLHYRGHRVVRVEQERPKRGTGCAGTEPLRRAR